MIFLPKATKLGHMGIACELSRREAPKLPLLEVYPIAYELFPTKGVSLPVLHLLPYELACRYHCVPIGTERGALTVATGERLDHEVISHFREVTQRDIFQIRCEAGIIDEVLRYWQRIVMFQARAESRSSRD